MATLQSLVTGKGYDASQGIIDEVTKLVPELATFAAILINGTSFQSVAQISDPVTGFRTAGNGTENGASRREHVVFLNQISLHPHNVVPRKRKKYIPAASSAGPYRLHLFCF